MFCDDNQQYLHEYYDKYVKYQSLNDFLVVIFTMALPWEGGAGGEGGSVALSKHRGHGGARCTGLFRVFCSLSLLFVHLAALQCPNGREGKQADFPFLRGGDEER